MAYTYTPTYYSSFQDTITTFCKSILPFKNRRLPAAANRKLAKRHTDNLKWQQDSFHRILNLIGLRNEGIVPDAEVSAFRVHLLDTLIASPADPDTPTLIRDKLLFLQELLYAKCISAEEYHSSKRPLVQWLAAQGVEIDCRDVIVGDRMVQRKAEEEWSDIDLGDEVLPTTAAEKDKEKRPLKLLWRGKAKREGSNSNKDKEGNREDCSSILMPPMVAAAKPERASKRKPFRALFQKEQQDEEDEKSSKKHWGLEGFKKWKRGEDEWTKPYLPQGERSDDDASAKMVKKKTHSYDSPSDFKIWSENIKKELSQIQLELSARNQNMNFSDDEMNEISKKLPADKTDLSKFFPKPWCNRYGDNVIDVVKREFEDHAGEIGKRASMEKRDGSDGGSRVAFEDKDENLHCSPFYEDAEAGYVNNKSFSVTAQNHCWNPKWDK